MIALTAMTIQIIDNNPDGIRICRVDGESLVTVVVPRDMLGEAKCLPDLPDRGVYYLLDEDHGVLSRVYAGQTTRGLVRLDAHKTKKEFWNKAIMFLDNDVNIDRDVLEELSLELPTYHLCSEDCPGLCPRCGKRLDGACKCAPEKHIDPRMEIFKKLLDNADEK